MVSRSRRGPGPAAEAAGSDADIWEQKVEPTDEEEAPALEPDRLPNEVSEADALDQLTPVPLDDDREY